ncbi:TlpA family protein disulfide reductase [Mucilaginibacter sp. HC2]|uniref:TlpA family protein disulfide reductase n=1 Tax=Mucilaginibacter inviolabilis TaxID=2714892 RepID=UPI001407EEA3|nr:TlpA disulfide reductase family protein [Mucilaginibacter inviolabilis]NHA06580.1 TlpA family protein disulfide reductase [Mucilaginibacter inviolabilis]
MNKILLSFVIAFSFALSVQAQIEITRPIEQLGFNKTTIVTNARGKKLTYQDWSKLMSTGKYKLSPVQHDSDSTAFILTERDETAENKVMAKAPKPEETKFFKNGNSFTFFDMKEVNGTILRQADLKGKIVVLNFWFIACPPCRYEMPELNRLTEAYQGRKDVVFIGISLDKTDNIERFLKVSPFKYHIVGDSMPLFAYYGVDQCPASLVVDKDGTIRFNSQGYGEGAVPYWIRKTIDEIN